LKSVKTYLRGGVLDEKSEIRLRASGFALWASPRQVALRRDKSEIRNPKFFGGVLGGN
jgi:hypothetical protein